MRIKNIANLYLVLALVLGALVPVMLKVGSQNLNTYEFLFLAYLAALPVSLGYILYRKKAKRLLATMGNLKEFGLMAFLGVLNYGMLEYGLSYAERFINASLATAIYRSSPLLMLLFLPIMLKERVSKLQLAALLLGFAGIYIAVIGGNLAIFGGANVSIIMFVVLIALSTAFVSVAVKRYSFDMEIAVFVFNLAMVALSAILLAFSRAPLQSIDYGALLSILYVGVIYNVFVGLMYYLSLRMTKTTLFTNIYFLSPFITFVFSWAILGEQIYPYYLAIAALVSVGILIQKFDKRGGTYLASGRQEQVFHDVTSAFINTGSPLIYDVIKGGGRVLAIKVEKDYYQKLRAQMPKRRSNGVVVYADTNRKYINEEQREFISEIMGLGKDELAIMCAGDTESGEKTLSEMLSYKI